MPWQQVSACLLPQSPGQESHVRTCPKVMEDTKTLPFFSWTQLGRCFSPSSCRTGLLHWNYQAKLDLLVLSDGCPRFFSTEEVGLIGQKRQQKQAFGTLKHCKDEHGIKAEIDQIR